jgi:deoxyuridine 5'-triphosphate nucleotidohydrolase
MPNTVSVRYQKLSPHARVPAVMQAGDVAADLYSAQELVVPARGRAVIATDLAIELPEGFRGCILPRSGLAAKHGIDTGAGVIDQGFRGNLSVLLFNHSDEDFPVQVGDRIAQLAIEPYWVPIFEEVLAVGPTPRSAGWGSSGQR